MLSINQRFLENLARNFMENRLAAVAENFVFPIPLYTQDTLQVFGASCTFQEVLTMYRDAAIRAGVTRMAPRILAEGLAINSYSNMWVEWDHFDASGACLRTSQVHYVCCHGAASLFPRIELVEYIETAFPEVSASFAVAKIA